MADVIVVGAGATGLACAFELDRAGAKVCVLDSSSRPGGVIGGVELEGYRFENGPNTLPASARHFRELAGELGIADRLIVSSPDARARFLFHTGALRPLPMGPLSLLTTPLLSMGSKLRLAMEPLRKRAPWPEGRNEQTLEALMSERLGVPAARTLAGAFVRGVYAAEAGDLGAASAFPRLWAMVQEHGGLVRGMLAKRKEAKNAAPLPGPDCRRSDLLSFPGGLEELTRALAEALGDTLRLSSSVERLTRTESGYRLELEGGEALEAPQVVLATPAPATAKLGAEVLKGLDLPMLTQQAHASVTVVHLGLDSAPLPSGFGFLVPPDETGPEAPRALGVLFPSRIFPGRAPEGCDSVSAIYRTSDLADDDPVEVAREDLKRALGTSPGVSTTSIVRWKNVIPRYEVGHAPRALNLVNSAREKHPGLHLAGNYQGGVSVEDCLGRGRMLARRLVGRSNA